MQLPSFSRRRFLEKAVYASGALATHSFSQAVHAAPVPSSIGAEAAAHGILAGCAVNEQGLASDADFRRLVAAQAAIVVPENAMKWRSLRPSPTTFDYSAADRLVDFAEENQLRIRGHNLCWNQALPDWLEGTVNASNAQHLLTDHIRHVVGRYAGRIQSWDVVNEAVNVHDGRPDGLGNSIWLTVLGPGYLDIAFRAARTADPHALLVYNDFGVELDNAEQAAKRDAVFKLVTSLKRNGTPIDAVGIQSHLSATSTDSFGSGLRQFIAGLRRAGFKVLITELDVDDSHVAGDDAMRDRAVAEIYHSYLNLVLDAGVRTILTWGITDRYSWLTEHFPRADKDEARGLPFDEHLRPVDAYWRMVESFGRVRG